MSKYRRHIHRKERKSLLVSSRADSKLVDRLTYLVAAIEPVVTLPQVYLIFRDKTAEGIAISSWIGYELFTIVWLWYGIVHKEKVIIFYQLCWLILQAVIIVGGLTYGAKWF